MRCAELVSILFKSQQAAARFTARFGDTTFQHSFRISLVLSKGRVTQGVLETDGAATAAAATRDSRREWPAPRVG
jgi:hypothetical protein